MQSLPTGPGKLPDTLAATILTGEWMWFFALKKRISASVKIACQLKQPNNSKPLARFHLLFRQVCRGQTCRMGERRSTFVLIGLVGKKKESIFGFGSS